MTLLVESCPGYRRITLNRPERLNALNVEMAAALDAVLDEAAADKTCRAILLTGAGRGFCAGQDLTEIVGASPADLERLLEHYHPLILKIRALSIPVVCAVNGVAAGAGANLALACDIVLAARSATFVQAFTRIGPVPACGGTRVLPRLVGTARARALAFLAEPLPAETAAEWGLVWRMTEDERLLPEAGAPGAPPPAAPARPATPSPWPSARSTRPATTRSRNNSISKANCSVGPGLIPTMPRASAPFLKSARLPSPRREAERRSSRRMPAPAKMRPLRARKSAETCDKVA